MTRSDTYWGFTYLRVRTKILSTLFQEAKQRSSIITLLNDILISSSPDNATIEFVAGAQPITTGDDTASVESSQVTVVRIKPGRSPLRNKVPKGEFDTNYPSILEFLVDLINGEIKGFIRPSNEQADTEAIR